MATSLNVDKFVNVFHYYLCDGKCKFRFFPAVKLKIVFEEVTARV